MSSNFESSQTTQRFLRPADPMRLRRNHRHVQAHRVLKIARNVVISALLVLAGVWAYRQTQSDARFAVRKIEIAGAVHTPRAAIDAVTQRYAGLNLFQIDIARVQRDLGTLPWIARIDIEKKLPDTLRITIAERVPLALVQSGSALRYVDQQGVTFAELSPSVGDDDLPLITDAAGPELARTIALIRDLRARDPLAFARISEVRPVAPEGFALFDRQLGASLYANRADLSQKLRHLDAILAAEQLRPGSIEYADLRFDDRIVIKPVHPFATVAAQTSAAPQALITN
jgi:cell division protein FtsQ